VPVPRKFLFIACTAWKDSRLDSRPMDHQTQGGGRDWYELTAAGATIDCRNRAGRR